MDFSGGLKKARKAAKLTQEDLAGVLGTTVDTIQNWEQPKRNVAPNLKTFLALCDFFSCTPNDLLGVEPRRGHLDILDLEVGNIWCRCDACGRMVITPTNPFYNYCPWCGAEVIEEEDGNG